MRSRKLLSTIIMTAAVLVVAAATYLLTSPRTSRTPATPPATEAATAAPDTASVEGPSETLSSDPADTQNAQPGERDHRTWMRDLSDALIRRGDAHSLAAAALLMNANAVELSDPTERRDAFRGRVLDLLQHAAKAAPTDATVQSLALVFCRDLAYQIAGCDPRLPEDALLAIDPANAWAATGELRRANTARDPAQQAVAIARMSRSPRLDTHRAEIETLFANAIQSVAVAPDDRAAQDALPSTRRLTTGAVNAAPVDPLDAVTTACDRPPEGEAHRNCMAVAKLMRSSPDPLVADQGLALARHLVPAGSPLAAELAKEKRREDWQMAAFLRMPRTPEQNARFMRDRMPSAELRREVLLENGVPLDPPSDWPSP